MIKLRDGMSFIAGRYIESTVNGVYKNYLWASSSDHSKWAIIDPEITQSQ